MQKQTHTHTYSKKMTSFSTPTTELDNKQTDRHRQIADFRRAKPHAEGFVMPKR